uniref:T2SSC domain-containing protein n=1 Tax=Steinernema glaseri TaxID=37863 RepID=A0A1I7XZD2_9BILA
MAIFGETGQKKTITAGASQACAFLAFCTFELLATPISPLQKENSAGTSRSSLSNFLLREHNHPAGLAQVVEGQTPSVYAIGQPKSVEVHPLQQGEVQLTRAG